MSTTLLCPSWTQNSQNQTPCEIVQQVDRVCTYTYNIVVSSPVEGNFIPYGSNVTACTCSWASYNLLSACMFCASSSPSLVSWDEWTTNCPANLTSTTTYLPSYAGTSLPSNTSIPCYAGYDPRNWQNGQFNEKAASSFPTGVNLDLTGVTSSCAVSSSSRKTPVGAIVGGVLGGVFVLLLFCGCVVFAIHRRRRRTLKSSPEITDPTSDGVNTPAKAVEPATTNDSTSTHLDLSAEKHPVANLAPIQVVDHAHTIVAPLISDSHYRPQAQGVGAGLSSQGVSTIARAPEQVAIRAHTVPNHTNSFITVHKSYCPQAPPARAVVPQECNLERPLPAMPATKWTPMEVDHGNGVGGWGVSMEDRGNEMDGWKEALPRDSGIVSCICKHDGDDDRETVERVGSVLIPLYGEDSRTAPEVIHDSSPATDVQNLRTVTQAEDEIVKALLISDSDPRNRSMGPNVFGIPRSSPFVAMNKGPVSEDMIRRVVYTYEMDPATKPHTGGLKLDLLFILDLTGSQQPYIDNVRASINNICAEIRGSDCMKSAESDDLRVAFIGFRDHPPQDLSFVTREWDFTSDISTISTNVRSLPDAGGGGDGPEAVAAAIDRALHMEWRSDCNKVAVLISDAPPHGIGNDEFDFWPHGVPGVRDPLEAAREMLKQKITLHFIACEPTLSEYENALDFYRGLTRITSGIVIPLYDARVMATCIIGSTLESLAIQDLIDEYRETIKELIPTRELPLVVKYLHALMRVRSRIADQLIMENIYTTSEIKHENVQIWSLARDLDDAKARLT